MSTQTLVHSDSTRDGGAPLIERFLRERDEVWQQIQLEYRLDGLIRQMLINSAGALALYGAVLGISHSPLQALASAIKLPILFLLTIAICLPTLYLFNLFSGGQLSAQQTLALMLAAITVTSALTVAFAPITLFFLITAPDYGFFVLLNVAILTLTGSLGLRFLAQGIDTINALELEDAAEAATERAEEQADVVPARRVHPMNIHLLRLSLLLYGFVGTQLGWTLRPFFGIPDRPFQLFRSIEGNFYMSIIHLLWGLLSF
ncbi:MAG TPA: hypothetical protein VER55_08010 [Ardenticatenaceae bacterium]|nr:hypothetical protein [Ardenticatenaceae bacterium]